MLTVTITNTIMSKTRNAGGGGGIPPSNTVAPVISGTAVVGQTLSSTTGTWLGTPIPTYTYQWYRGANPISGATSSTYTLVQADATFAVTCVVTATNPAGIASATSNALTIIDADAQAFFTASGLTGTTNQSAINKLVVDMKGYGIWTKMKAIYPFIGGTAALHKWNLKDPQDTNAAFRLVFTGGWTHSSTGALPNGTNAFANTFLDSATIGSTGSLGYYSRTNFLTNNINIDLGYLRPTPDSYSDLQIEGHVGYLFRYNNDGSVVTSATITDSRGFFLGSRTTNHISYRNGIQLNSYNLVANQTANIPFYIGASNFSGTATYFANRECAFACLGTGLTGTEAANFYTAVQAYQTTLGRSVGPQTVSDPDAQAFVTAANIEDQVQAQAVNQLVIDMKAANIWNKMKAVYPFVGGTAASHKFNLKNPLDTDAAFRLVFSGGWTHSSTGATPNGTNAFANTYLSPSTQLLLTSTHLSYYSRTNVNLTQVEIGSQSGTAYTMIEARTANTSYFLVNTNSIGGASDTNSAAFYIANRTASNVNNGFRNNVKIANFTFNADALPVNNIYIGALNNLAGSAQYYTTKECAFASLGAGLTDTEAANFYTAVQAYQTTLSRNV